MSYLYTKKGVWSLEEVNSQANLNSWDESKKEYLWLSGSNSHGELGNQTTIANESPIQVGGEEWNNFSAGRHYILATKSDGSLWGWGRNNHGQLGSRHTGPRSSPIQINGPDTYWRFFSCSSADGDHTLAIKNDGTLWGWGHNTWGQLGLAGGVKASNYFSRSNLSRPIEVFGQADWQLCSAGRISSLGIRGDGSLFCWGHNGAGQLGQDDTQSKSSPVQVAGKWKTAMMFRDSTLAISADDGYLYCWGDNQFGQIGQNNTSNYSSPIQISAGWKRVEGSGRTVLGVKYDGTMWAWGEDVNGVTGADTLTRYTSPNSGLGTSWTEVNTSLLGNHTLAIKENNTLYSFGGNLYGELGLGYSGNTNYQSSPTQIVGNNWVSVSAGSNYSYALRSDGTLWGWGRNNNGQLGQDDIFDRSSPVQIPGTTWDSVSTGSLNFVYSIKSNGTLYSWGRNNHGQLGLTDTVDRSSPVQIPGTTWVNVSCGNNHALILRSDSSLFGVGLNEAGQLGTNNTVNALEPIQVLGTGYDVPSAGSNFSVSKKTDGTLWAWGLNDCGQLGQSDRIPRSSPVQIPGTTWSRVYAGSNNVIAFKNDGTMWAWGENLNGHLGTGDFITYSSPVQVTSGYSNWNTSTNKKFSVGSGRVFAIHDQNDLYFMGPEISAEIPAIISRSSPTQITGTDWDDFAFSSTTVIAKKQNGTQWTWGRTKWLPSGASGITQYYSSPVQIQGTLWKNVSIGPDFIVGTKDI